MQVQNAHPKTMPDCAAPEPVRVKKMENRTPVHRLGQVPCLHKFDGTHFLVAVPHWPAHASRHCEEERRKWNAGLFLRVSYGYSR